MDKEKSKQAIEKVFRDMAGAMSAGMAYVGTRTGLFRAMQGKGPMTLDAVVKASQLQPRYVEEWLKGMASAGYLDYDPAAQTWLLSEEMAYFVASDGTDHFVGGMWEMVPPLLTMAPRVAEAFRKGGGVPFGDYGPDCVHALDLINRGQYEQRFAGYWLSVLPEVTKKLGDGGSVLDFGCGSGRVSMALKQAFPKAKVVGYDIDAASVAKAREISKEVEFTTTLPKGEFDLISICDCIHDLASPVSTLKDIYKRMKPDGSLFIIEPKAADRLEDNKNSVATMFYGFSVFHCMTQSLAAGGPGLGTCLGPAGTERVVREAGFTQFRKLDIKSQTNLFYEAKK